MIKRGKATIIGCHFKYIFFLAIFVCLHDDAKDEESRAKSHPENNLTSIATSRKPIFFLYAILYFIYGSI